jgi:beta-N-acetylhexosaminidase
VKEEPRGSRVCDGGRAPLACLPVDTSTLSLEQVCGQLIVGGFHGTELPGSFAASLAAGHCGGAILFRRNCAEIEGVARLCAAIAVHRPTGVAPIIAVDQEGGRVARLPEPFLTLPPMATLGALDDAPLTQRAAEQVGSELRSLGFSVDFAPVLDVDSNPDNPVIGDRSFGSHPAAVGRHGRAFAVGLQAAGIAACGKHFPGHGDTSLDSHVELPTVPLGAARLEAVELRPFRDACRAGIAALMSAHVVYPALDPERPATLSRAVCTELLRHQMGFEGVLFSDDLEMGAIAGRHGIERAAVDALAAGCDALLICSEESLQQRAHQALVRAAQGDPRFHDRCHEAFGRVKELRRRFVPQGVASAESAEAPGATLAERLAELVGGSASKVLVERLGSAARQVEAETKG